MLGIFGSLYLIFFLGFVIASFIILFHLSRYSINRRVVSISALIFVIVMIVLLSTNALLFFNLPWDTLSSNTFYMR